MSLVNRERVTNRHKKDPNLVETSPLFVRSGGGMGDERGRQRGWGSRCDRHQGGGDDVNVGDTDLTT